MKKNNSVTMVRKIRDKQNKDISGKSDREIIDYFRKKAAQIFGKARAEVDEI